MKSEWNHYMILSVLTFGWHFKILLQFLLRYVQMINIFNNYIKQKMWRVFTGCHTHSMPSHFDVVTLQIEEQFKGVNDWFYHRLQSRITGKYITNANVSELRSISEAKLALEGLEDLALHLIYCVTCQDFDFQWFTHFSLHPHSKQHLQFL